MTHETVGWLVIVGVMVVIGGGLAWFIFRDGHTWDDER